ncbi:hypothetical protein [Chitinolyticbacter meiyuanensis]|uniref:hypothetical protein n=1 Tax=Chitinolyticbacter meiyuanensis TaxID=682798 RepID=UPI0011E5F1E4|nr:hypothetical protein [Chitinolyticbacter meiyuanensis]
MFLLGQLVGLVYFPGCVPNDVQLKLLSRPLQGFHALLLQPETIEMIDDERVASIAARIPARLSYSERVVVDFEAYWRGFSDMHRSLRGLAVSPASRASAPLLNLGRYRAGKLPPSRPAANDEWPSMPMV